MTRPVKTNLISIRATNTIPKRPVNQVFLDEPEEQHQSEEEEAFHYKAYKNRWTQTPGKKKLNEETNLVSLFIEPIPRNTLIAQNVFELEVEITIREGHPQYNSYQKQKQLAEDLQAEKDKVQHLKDQAVAHKLKTVAQQSIQRKMEVDYQALEFKFGKSVKKNANLVQELEYLKKHMEPEKYEEIRMNKNLQDLYDALLEKSDGLEERLARTEDELAIA